MLLNHITHNLSDQNSANLRISSLRKLMMEYEPIPFEDKPENHYNYLLLLLLLTLLILYITYNNVVSLLFRRERKPNVMLALPGYRRLKEQGAKNTSNHL